MSILYSTPSEESPDELERQIGDFLRRLGISGKLIGHKYLTVSIAQTVHDPDRIRYITKDLYPDLAKQYRSKASRVERAMRTAIQAWWQYGNRTLFEVDLNIKLQRHPTNSEFIDLLANYFRNR